MSKVAKLTENTEDINSNEEWDDPNRKDARFSRIRARVSTGHPMMAKKLLAERHALKGGDEDSESEEQETPPKDLEKKKKSSKSKSSKEEVVVEKKKVSKPKATINLNNPDIEALIAAEEAATRKKHSSSKKKSSSHKASPTLGTVETASGRSSGSDSDEQVKVIVKEAKPSKSSTKSKSAKTSSKPRFGEAKKIQDEDDDEEWDVRHEERSYRLRSRLPTGHPGLAKKVEKLRETINQ